MNDNNPAHPETGGTDPKQIVALMILRRYKADRLSVACSPESHGLDITLDLKGLKPGLDDKLIGQIKQNMAIVERDLIPNANEIGLKVTSHELDGKLRLSVKHQDPQGPGAKAVEALQDVAVMMVKNEITFPGSDAYKSAAR